MADQHNTRIPTQTIFMHATQVHYLRSTDGLRAVKIRRMMEGYCDTPAGLAMSGGREINDRQVLKLLDNMKNNHLVTQASSTGRYYTTEMCRHLMRWFRDNPTGTRAPQSVHDEVDVMSVALTSHRSRRGSKHRAALPGKYTDYLEPFPEDDASNDKDTTQGVQQMDDKTQEPKLETTPEPTLDLSNEVFTEQQAEIAKQLRTLMKVESKPLGQVTMPEYYKRCDDLKVKFTHGEADRHGWIIRLAMLVMFEYKTAGYEMPSLVTAGDDADFWEAAKTSCEYFVEEVLKRMEKGLPTASLLYRCLVHLGDDMNRREKASEDRLEMARKAEIRKSRQDQCKRMSEQVANERAQAKAAAEAAERVAAAVLAKVDAVEASVAAQAPAVVMPLAPLVTPPAEPSVMTDPTVDMAPAETSYSKSARDARRKQSDKMVSLSIFHAPWGIEQARYFRSPRPLTNFPAAFILSRLLTEQTPNLVVIPLFKTYDQLYAELDYVNRLMYTGTDIALAHMARHNLSSLICDYDLCTANAEGVLANNDLCLYGRYFLVHLGHAGVGRTDRPDWVPAIIPRRYGIKDGLRKLIPHHPIVRALDHA